MRRVPPLHREMTEDARARYRAWIAAEPDLSRLGNALVDRVWHDGDQSGYGAFMQPLYRSLSRADIAELKSELVRRIEAAGGRIKLGSIVAIVTAGELRISMA
jgi:hypothetical protein